VQPWDEAFRELRDEFVTSSRERLAGMEVLAAALARDPGDHATRDALRRDFHGLAGSGTTYGFPRISELGLDGEQRLRPLEDGSVPPLSERDLAGLRPSWNACAPPSRAHDCGPHEQPSAYTHAPLRARGDVLPRPPAPGAGKESAMSVDKPDHHDAEIAMKVYELRREAVMRESRSTINAASGRGRTRTWLR